MSGGIFRFWYTLRYTIKHINFLELIKSINYTICSYLLSLLNEQGFLYLKSEEDENLRGPGGSVQHTGQQNKYHQPARTTQRSAPRQSPGQKRTRSKKRKQPKTPALKTRRSGVGFVINLKPAFGLAFCCSEFNEDKVPGALSRSRAAQINIPAISAARNSGDFPVCRGVITQRKR